VRRRLLVLVAGALVLLAPVAMAQEEEPTTTSTTAAPEETTSTTSLTILPVPTTEPEVTTTTEPDVTTTTEPEVTTTTESTLPPTTSTLVPGPIVEESPSTTALQTTTSLPQPEDPPGEGLGTDTIVRLIIGGLLFVAVGLGALTYWYWRATDPRARAQAAGR